MAFDLQEYLKYRVEVGRELLNVEVDTNFRVVANPWVNTRVYQVGYIVYNEVDSEVTGETRLGWFRANTTTTKGLFVSSEWDEIGGGGGGGGGSLAVKDEGVLIDATTKSLNFIADADASLSSTIANEVNITVGNKRVIGVGETYTIPENFSKTVGNFVNLGTTVVEGGTSLAPGVTNEGQLFSITTLTNTGTINVEAGAVVEIISTLPNSTFYGSVTII
jgi:hypothetical protein